MLGQITSGWLVQHTHDKHASEKLQHPLGLGNEDFLLFGSFQELAEKVVLLQGQEVFHSLATHTTQTNNSSLHLPSAY